MKKHQNLLLALVILTALAGGLWEWKKEKASTDKTARGVVRPPSIESSSTSEPVPATQLQTAKDPAPAGAAPRRFIDMTARESREILREIKATDADALLQLFLDAGRVEQDPMKQSALQGKLVGAIKEKKYSPGFIARMKKFVLDESNSKLERGLVTSAFAGARTEEGTEFILWALANQTDPYLRSGIISNISGLGGSQPYLPAMIEPLWRESQDPALLKAVAMAMAKEAAPSSVELLLAAAAAPDGQDDMRQIAAFRAMLKIYREDAVPPLESALNNTPPGSKMNGIALFTLSKLGHKNAAQAVIKWLQAADSSAVPQVADWISRANSESHQQAAEAALNPSVPFRSEENREAIRAALAALRDASIKIGPNNK